MPTINKKKVLVTFSNWVVDEILKAKLNKSDFIQEAVIKLHMDKERSSSIATRKANKVHSEDFTMGLSSSLHTFSESKTCLCQS